MTFEKLMIALNDLKNKAKELNIKEKDIKNMKIVDILPFNAIIEKDLDIVLGKKGIEYYLLIKDKNK